MEAAAYKILIVDDDPTMLHLLAKGLAVDQSRYQVLCAGSGREAIHIMERIRVSMIVSDVKMPGMSGLDLLAHVRQWFPDIQVVLMTGEPYTESDPEIVKSGCLRFLTKPIDIQHLRQLIVREMTAREGEGFTGTLKNIQLADLIQMCCNAEITTAIRVYHDSGHGTIYLQDGAIVHAEQAELAGPDAFYRIFLWRSGRFETLTEAAAPASSIDKNWQYLIMEGHRRIDEADVLAEIREESADAARAASSSHPKNGGSAGGQGREPVYTFELEADPVPDENSGADHETVKPDEAATCEPYCLSEEESRAAARVIRVLIVDPSLYSLQTLVHMLSSDRRVRVAGTARNGEDALQMVQETHPDLIILDVNMPVKEGSTALHRLMIECLCPVLIFSAFSGAAHSPVMNFLMMGAVDVIQKPERISETGGIARQLIQKIHEVSGARMNRFRVPRIPKGKRGESRKIIPLTPSKSLTVILSGAGGYPELIRLLPLLPRDVGTCLVVIQVFPAPFHATFNRFLADRSDVQVELLAQNEPISSGRCFTALNETPLGVFASGKTRYLHVLEKIVDGKTYHGMPDRFLKKAANIFRDRIRVLLLSGAELGLLDGLISVRGQGGRVYAQRRETCLIANPIERAATHHLITREMDTAEMLSVIGG